MNPYDNIRLALQSGKPCLFVMDQGIGNMINMTPAIKAVKEMYPNVEIDVFGQNPALEVVRNTKYVHRAVDQPIADRKYGVTFMALWYHHYAMQYVRQLRACSDQIVEIAIDDINVPEYERFFKIAEIAGWDGEMPHAFWSERAIDISYIGEPLIGLCDTSLPGKEWDRKRWPYYKQLATKLVQNNWKVVLVGGDYEKSCFVPREWPRQIHSFCGELDIPQTISLLSQCDLVVGNDSGPTRLACVAGTNTIFITGATNIGKNIPLSYGNTIVVSKPMACAPCQYTDRWEQCTGYGCMTNISVDDIMQVVNTIIDKGGDNNGESS